MLSDPEQASDSTGTFASHGRQAAATGGNLGTAQREARRSTSRPGRYRDRFGHDIFGLLLHLVDEMCLNNGARRVDPVGGAGLGNSAVTRLPR